MPEAPGPSPHPAFQGISTFLSTPQAETASDLGRLKADVAIIGAPVDMGVMNRPGARFGPRAIRRASYFGSDHHEIYHIGLGVYPLEALRVADFGWAWLKDREN